MTGSNTLTLATAASRWTSAFSLIRSIFFSMTPQPPRSTLFPYTTLFRSPPSPTSSSCPAAQTSGTTGSRSGWRSEEHTSELQSLRHLVCRLLLEKKKNDFDHFIIAERSHHGA